MLCRCTGYRKIITAVCDVGGETGSDPAQNGRVGYAVARLDGAAKVAGDSFGADYSPDGALVVQAIR